MDTELSYAERTVTPALGIAIGMADIPYLKDVMIHGSYPSGVWCIFPAAKE